ncbi:hypothetical protein AgCh_016435 [Apium graveolens]
MRKEIGLGGMSGLGDMIQNYFQQLFTAVTTHTDEVLTCISKVVTEQQNAELLRPNSDEEVRDAVVHMHHDKAPGPDGMTPTFFQKNWKIVGKDVIVTKVMANQLKEILDKSISTTQSAFFPGRLITDNIMISFEVMHYLKRKKFGKEGFMALKLDMSKAYDRIEWKILQDILLAMGFSTWWTHLIIQCVSTVKYNIVHGEHTLSPIVPTRAQVSYGETFVKQGKSSLQGQVSELVDTKDWDREILLDIFYDRDRQAILNTVIEHDLDKDILCWNLEHTGHYSVKSVCRLIQQQKGVWNEGNNIDFWKSIWNIKAPPQFSVKLRRRAGKSLKMAQILRELWNLQIGAGIVARNHDGHLILAKSIYSPDVMNPTLEEAMVVKEALSWAMEMGWSSVTIESDCMVVIQLIRSSTPMRSRLGMVITMWKDLTLNSCEENS